MKLKAWTKSVGSFFASMEHGCGVILPLTLLIAGSVTAQVINDPVAYWSFDDTATILSNRVISSPYHDASILFGQPTAGIEDGADGVAGNSMILDGSTAIRLPYHQDNLGTSFTLSLWYWQLTNDTRQCVYQTRDSYTATYEAMIYDNTNFASYVGQSLVEYITTGPQEWINLVHVFSNANNNVTLSVYTNGAFVFKKTVSSNSVFNVNQVRGFHVGAYRSATSPLDGRCFKGMIDEMALWKRDLSADEVSAVYQRGAGGQNLEFTPQALPSISLKGKLSFLLNVDDGLPEGMFNNAWLLNGVQDPVDQSIVLDTADDMLEYVPDTAGHVDGPFHARISDDKIKWLVSSTTALRQLSQTNFTVETWFRTTSQNSRNVLMGNYYNSPKGIINLELHGANNVRLYQGNAAGTVTDLNLAVTNGNTRDGQWHHLAGVRTNNTMVLYLDGTEVGSTTTATGFYVLADKNFYLGRDIRTGDYPFDGELGHTRLWTRALSANELTSIAALKLVGGSDVSRSGLLAEYALYNPYHAGKSSPWYRFPATSPQLRQIPLADFTLDAVFRTTASGARVLLGNYSSTCKGALNLMLESDGGVRLYLKNAAETVDSLWLPPGTINTRDGEWHHLVGVRDATTMILYLDGEEVGSAEARGEAYTLDGSHYYIGKDARNTFGVFDGDIVHARIWNRALTAIEVAGLSASNAVPVEGLVAKYTPTLLNSLHTAGFPGTRFLRSFTTATNTSTLLFTDLPRHNKISFSLLLAQLDSLDPVADNDHFEIRVDGLEVLSVGLGPDNGSEPQVVAFKLFGVPTDTQVFKDTMTAGGEELFVCATGGYSINDHVYDLASLEALQAIPHTGSTLTLELLGVHNAGGENEGFGIDQIQLNVIPPLGTLILIF